MRLKLTVEYDGSDFRGWARQPSERTVEGELRGALAELYELHHLAVAGRTDTGVHALANVVSIGVAGGPPAGRAPGAVNALLPADVAVTEAEQVPDDFHARHNARSRSYRYRVWRRRERSPLEARRSLWHPHRLDLDALTANAEALLGEHDFRAFTPTQTEHEVFVRTIRSARWIQSRATRERSRPSCTHKRWSCLSARATRYCSVVMSSLTSIACSTWSRRASASSGRTNGS